MVKSLIVVPAIAILGCLSVTVLVRVCEKGTPHERQLKTINKLWRSCRDKCKDSGEGRLAVSQSVIGKGGGRHVELSYQVK